ncbi:hypothetical protein LJC58_01755 [Lachnospiraceae bacterium OttesenSCG-928-D06]|nr:hypothetical protein [Lachnospiraceae bacterium OttesenSCG-928-D06]
MSEKREYWFRRFMRPMSFILALVLFLSPLLGHGFPFSLFQLIEAEAATVRVSQTGGNLLDGISFPFYGSEDKLRNSIFIWRDTNQIPVFCLEPGKKMNSNTSLTIDWHSMEDDWGSIELDDESKELLWYALAAAGCAKGNANISTAEYIMVQSAIWAILSGEWTTADDFKENMEVIISHIKGDANKARIQAEVRQLVDQYVTSINAFAGNNSQYTPGFAAKYMKNVPVQRMTSMGDGVYQFTAETVPGFVFKTLEGKDPEGWSIVTSGNTITFTCDKKQGGSPNLTLMGIPEPGGPLSGLLMPKSVGILTPGGEKQMMIAQVEAVQNWTCYVQFHEGFDFPEIGGDYSVEAYRFSHDEDFKSNYRIELYKKDGETGQPLENTMFSILEAFDKGQLKGTNLDSGQFRTPAELTEHEQAATNENGYIIHSDTKHYLLWSSFFVTLLANKI